MKNKIFIFIIFILIFFIQSCFDNSFKTSVLLKDQDIKYPMWTISETGAKLYKSPQKGMTLDKIPYNQSVEILEFRIIGNQNNNIKWFYVKWKNKMGWVEAEELSFLEPANIKTLLMDYNWYYFNEDFTYNSKIEGLIESYINSKKIEYNNLTKFLVFRGDKKTKNIEYKISKITPVMIILDDLKNGKKYYLYREKNPLFTEFYYNRKINIENYIKDIHLLNSRNYNGNTPFMYSLQRNKDTADIIFEHEPEINSKNINGYNALAFSLKDSELFLNLLRRGADVKFKTIDNNDSILHLYYKNNNDWDLMPDFTRILVADGIDVNSKNNKGITPLHILCSRFNKDIQVDSYLETFKILLDAGADINAQDNDGYTCMHYISYRYNYELIKYMIENGADPNKKDKNNNVPLITLLDYDLESAELLLEKGADPTIINKDGNSGISIIEKNFGHRSNYDNIIKQLIQKGYEINLKFDNKNTLLHYSVLNGNLELTKLLINKQYDVNSINNDGKTPLHYTHYNKNGYKLVKLLLDNGVNVNQQDNYKRTALHYAADSNNKNLVEELLKYGADKTIKDKDGKTPAEIAQAYGSGRVYPLLADSK